MFVYRFEFHGYFSLARHTSPFVLSFPFISLSYTLFYVFTLLFSLYTAKRGTTPARPHRRVQREDTNWSAERRCRTVEVARLVSTAYTAIRPSYTSAATRAAPSSRRPSSLLSPRSRALLPSPAPRVVVVVDASEMRVIARATRCFVSIMKRSSRANRRDRQALFVIPRRIYFARSRPRERGHWFFEPVKCNPRTCALISRRRDIGRSVVLSYSGMS